MEAILYEQSKLYNNTGNYTVINDSTLKFLYGFDYISLAIAFLFNKIGIFLLMKVKTCGSVNQNILLVNLSLISVIILCLDAAGLFWKSSEKRYPNWFITLYYITYVAYIVNLIVMLIDRLLYVVLGLKKHCTFKYCSMVTKSMIFMMLFLTWSLAIIFGIVNVLFIGLTIEDMLSALYVCDGLLIALSISFYITLRRFVWTSNPPLYSTKTIHHRKYSISFIIVAFFFLLVVVPTLILDRLQAFSPTYEKTLLVLIGIKVSNFIIVPIIYTLLQPKLRFFIRSTVNGIKNTIYRTVLYSKEDSIEQERLLIKSLYEGTNTSFGSI